MKLNKTIETEQNNKSFIDLSMSQWEAEKILYIFSAVEKVLGFDLWNDCTETGVNPNSGYSWVWNENYPVSFAMPISCELSPSCVAVIYSDSYDGEEHFAKLSDFSSDDDLYAWTQKLDALSEEKEKSKK